ncbi:MAG: SUMF1/EgtB/PvdO family nonheme iron enzyme, partial [Planctomycetota bacterium]
MIGNVGEWCRDTYEKNAYKKRAGKVTEDPWFQDAGERSLRSSSYREQPPYHRISRRWALAATKKDVEVGFRVCLQIEKAPK